MKVAFAGTSEFAVPILKKLLTGNWDIVSLICQPDSLQGRGRTLVSPPAKKAAVEFDIPVFQPDKIKSTDSISYIESLNLDIIITASYGQLLSERILNIPSLGCFNVHASLLPAYRGASPIRWAIISGEKKTGVTVFKMDPGMDTGKMALWEDIEIKEGEEHENLHDRLANIGADLAFNLLETFSLSSGQAIKLETQDEGKATYAPILRKKDGLIDWEKSGVEIERRIRGLYPWPGSYTFMEGKTIKILSVKALDEIPPYVPVNVPGSLYLLNKGRGIGVVCGKGCLELNKIKPENKKEQTSKQFLAGLRGIVEGKKFLAVRLASRTVQSLQ